MFLTLDESMLYTQYHHISAIDGDVTTLGGKVRRRPQGEAGSQFGVLDAGGELTLLAAETNSDNLPWRRTEGRPTKGYVLVGDLLGIQALADALRVTTSLTTVSMQRASLVGHQRHPRLLLPSPCPAMTFLECPCLQVSLASSTATSAASEERGDVVRMWGATLRRPSAR